MEEPIDFQMEPQASSIIKIIGVGGAGCNAVRNMFEVGVQGVDYAVCNTDKQALDDSPIPVKIQIGKKLTEGLGAGNKAERGRDSAIEDLDEIKEKLLGEGTKMVFVTAGMGGGTGTGAAPVIAKAAKDRGILTIGIVTIPFKAEGKPRLHQAIKGALAMSESVDSLLVIKSQNLMDMYGDLTQSESFKKADNVLATAAKGLAEMITRHQRINVDFADVRTALTDSGCALMGTGQCSGENRAHDAIMQAITSPLLNNNNIEGASHVLVNISSSSEHELKQGELGVILEELYELTGGDANANNTVIWGTGLDDSLGEDVRITVVVAGFASDVFDDSRNGSGSKSDVIHVGEDKSQTGGDSDSAPQIVHLPNPNGRDIESIISNTYGSGSVSRESKVYSTAELKPASAEQLDNLTESMIEMIVDNPAYERRKVS